MGDEIKVEKNLESVHAPAHDDVKTVIFRYNAAAQHGLTNAQTDYVVKELLETISYLTERVVFCDTMRFQGKEV